MIKIKNDKQTIGCSVNHCRYYAKDYCTLDKIKVAKCNVVDDEDTKEATMCDSYETE